MVTIATDYYNKFTRVGDRQVHADISLAYDEDGEREPAKRFKK